ncbi:MAG: hypothetical protein Fur0019_16130 [Tibeticola sp.]
MSRATLALLALLATLGGAVGGFFYGRAQGVQAEAARRDGQAVQQLTRLMESYRGLLDAADAASASLREAQAARAAQDRLFSREFRNALKASAAARAGCRFDDDSMRQLGSARDRAAAAASGGGSAVVPAAAARSGP